MGFDCRHCGEVEDKWGIHPEVVNSILALHSHVASGLKIYFTGMTATILKQVTNWFGTHG